MRNSATIKEWINTQELQGWIQESTDQKDYQKRLAIWLTATESLHAHHVARMLGVSKQAIWLWIAQYNENGPGGLDRVGRGGRRWGFLGLEEESHLLDSLLSEAANGQIITAKQIIPKINKLTGKKVSLAYVYKMLKRHQWRKLRPRPRHVKANLEKQEDFKKNYHHF